MKTGPVTELGRQRCAAAKTIHGFETRAKREYRVKKFAELKEIENLLFKKGFFDKVKSKDPILSHKLNGNLESQRAGDKRRQTWITINEKNQPLT